MLGLTSRRTTIAGALGLALVAGAATRAAIAKDSPRGLRVIAELISKPESADDARKILIPFARSARSEPGCIEYTLCEIQGDPGHFMTYEIWTDRPALDAHMKAPALVAIGPQLGPLLAKPFTQLFLDPLT